MPKKPKVTQTDIDLFKDAVKGVKPLPPSNKVRLKPATKKVVQRPIKENEEALSLSDEGNIHDVSGDEFISYKDTSISNKTLRKLRKGQYNIEARLDLHGLSVEEARETVDAFLRQCLTDNLRIVLIIHGKGRHDRMPILKNKLNHWLRNTPLVLAFCSAAAPHGSRGALYVLLKRLTGE